MENRFDAFSKSLAESVSRRDTLRRLGALFAGAVLSPLVLGAAPGLAAQTRAAVDCGTLTNCGGICVDLGNDYYNCGACGVVCGLDESCLGGVCYVVDPSPYPYPY